MLSKELFLAFISLGISVSCLQAQSDYISLGTKQYNLLERLDIKLRNDSVFTYTTTHPFNRKNQTRRVEALLLDSNALQKAGATPVDIYNMQRLLLDNSEWAAEYRKLIPQKAGIWGAFYKTPGQMYAVDEPDFTLRVNPLLNFQAGHSDDSTGALFVNARGISIKGVIANKLGFYTSIIETQERDPAYVRSFAIQNQAIPGQGFFNYNKVKDGAKNFDYTDVRGGITFNGGKYVDFVFAYDKLFIGNGFRSLFLSDFSQSYLFLKINTRIWKLNYQNIFAEQTAPFSYAYGDYARPKKYMTAHHLSFQAARWLNLGLFESIAFGRSNGFELSYLNPVIFLRAMERHEGSPDKASVGFDFKSNIGKSVQFYGQVLFNELIMSEFLRPGGGDWRNKQALQLGAKYIDAFKIRNLDLQAEMNIVRPFVYTHYDSAGSFTHYNQPLAHPLGANFRELIVLAKYQPWPKLYLEGKMITYLQGLDSAGYNFGSNLLLNYESRVRDNNLFIGSGTPVKSLTLAFNASYEFFENMFLDFNARYRTYNIQSQPKSNVFFYTVGLRVNLARREFDF